MTLLFNLGMSLLILLAALLIGGVRYFNKTYGAKAEQVFYTAVLPLEGTGGDDGETDVLTSDGKSTVAGPEPAKRAAGDNR